MAKEIQVSRYISDERAFVLATTIFTPVFEDYLAHTRRWVGEPDGLIAIMMKQGLAAAGLYLTFRALDENTGWTINMAEPPLNIFITSDARTGRVVGRYFDRDVQTVDHNRIFVQAVRNLGKPQLSAIEVKGFDVLSHFEQYYEQSEQLPARFFELPEDQFLMVAALPDSDEEWLQGLSREAAVELMRAPDVRKIDDRAVSFGCMCDPERVFTVVRKMFADKSEELFGGEDEVEVHCPRCGRAYRMTRADFAAT